MNTNDLQYIQATSALSNLVTVNSSGISDFKLKLYLEWIAKKTEYFQKETQSLNIPAAKLPRVISFQSYGHLKPNLQAIVDNAYDRFSDNYRRNSSTVSANDSTLLFKALYLSSRNVVWVDFGFNIGSEFGGRHPAIIIKNLGEVLIVAPISTNQNAIQASNTVITFTPQELYNMPSLRHRFTNITRITPVSLIRVDLDSPIGSVKTQKYNEILTKIKNFF